MPRVYLIADSQVNAPQYVDPWGPPWIWRIRGFFLPSLTLLKYPSANPYQISSCSTQLRESWIYLNTSSLSHGIGLKDFILIQLFMLFDPRTHSEVGLLKSVCFMIESPSSWKTRSLKVLERSKFLSIDCLPLSTSIWMTSPSPLLVVVYNS